MNTKPTIAEHLMDIQNVGDDAETCAAITEANAAVHKRRKKFTLVELLAECDPSAPPPRIDGWDEMVPVGKEILDDQGHKT